jgi:hypothetical protein
MSIRVGINENLVISEVGKNDKGTLSIKIQQAGEVDPLAALNASGSTNFSKAEKDFLVYPPQVEAYGGGVDTVENILKKIAEVKDPLNHILEQYTTSSNIKWDIFKGTGINTKTDLTKVTNEVTLTKIYNNITDQFIEMMTPFVSTDGKKMRMMFVRQSKAKHYPSFRKRFLESYPFIEPMEVPVSKLRFSKYEIDNNLNSGDTVTGQQTVSEEEKNTVETLFTTN